MSPQRVQLRRTKGWRKPEGCIVVSRPSQWANPFSVGSVVVLGDTTDPLTEGRPLRIIDHAVAVALFRAAFYGQPLPARRHVEDRIRRHLGGYDLACWCKIEDADGNRVPCHADVLLEVANS